MSVSGNIGLYLITGFLGAGKTTFLKNILSGKHGIKFGVLVNEFGSVGIDGQLLSSSGLEMIEVSGGSIFCACLKGEFVKGLIEFLSLPVDALFVEASGMADPFGMENLLTEIDGIVSKKGAASRRYDYKGSVCLVDAVNFLDYSDVFVSVGKQIEKSGLVVLNKTDLVPAEQLEETREAILEINGGAQIFETTFGQIPFELFMEKLNPAAETAAETSNRCDNRPASYILNMKERYSAKAVQAFLTEVSASAVRMKGFFADEDGEYSLADCVGDMVKITKAGKDKRDDCHLVIIGGTTELFEDKIVGAWQRYLGGKELDCVFDS